jgi:hypothetical protein
MPADRSSLAAGVRCADIDVSVPGETVPISPTFRLRARLVPVAVSLLALSACAHANTRPSLPPVGSRVRVTIPDSLRATVFTPRAQSVVGTLARSSPDTLWLQLGSSDSVRVARTTVRRLEVSRGASPLASALEQGLVLGVLSYGLAQAQSDRADRHERAVKIGLTAAGVAALVGAMRPYERWRRVR